MKIKILCALVAFGSLFTNANALTVTFHEDSESVLNFEMSGHGPTPGAQANTSPSGIWGIASFVYQYGPHDEYAEVGAFIKKLLPVSEEIGTDVISRVYTPAGLPVLVNAVNEFGEVYTGTFSLLPGSGDNAQEWDWVMTLKTGTASDPDPTAVSDIGSTWSLFGLGLISLFAVRRKTNRI